jgi:hypothetical protein
VTYAKSGLFWSQCFLPSLVIRKAQAGAGKSSLGLLWYICYRKCAVTIPYRMLAHSHSATSLYNLSQFKPISDQFTSIVYVVPASNLRTGVVWPRVVVLFFAIFTFWPQKYLDFVLFSRAILLAILFRSYLSTWKLVLIW